jgi:hypothetical protein
MAQGKGPRCQLTENMHRRVCKLIHNFALHVSLPHGIQRMFCCHTAVFDAATTQPLLLLDASKPAPTAPCCH